ncbi:hypothetical protein LB507_003657 [Fusarium sp. FIESC RH6]|nr:hypothetical protein LB507_003657 [Fusarium sp. FIESC RH6]
MNNSATSPFGPGLQVPVSSASPSGSNNTTTGRPPLWNSSSRRKMSRLYLYTTLPLERIVSVVHAKSPDSVPGMDSAHKTLNAMLNKQPRWLHPRTEQDMARRLDELSISPIRSNSGHGTIPSPTLGASATVPALDAVPTPHLIRNHTRASLEVPPFNQYPRVQQNAPNRSTAQIQEQEGRNTFGNFLQRSTFMTTSTDCTTGTFKSLVQDYGRPYVNTVKRLIKRYTAPLNRQGSDLSPISDEEPSMTSWLNDRDAPISLPNGPYYMPSNFLCIDQVASNQSTCFDNAEEHMRKACFCRPIEELQEPAWITVQGLTQIGINAASAAVNDGLFEERDQFGHTVFHLMAARFFHDDLFQAIRLCHSTDVLNAQNTAGQTILHVLHTCWFQSGSLRNLLDILAQKGFDFSARDHYGRSFSHLLLINNASMDLRKHLFHLCGPTNFQRRDAFGMMPTDIAPPEHPIGINRVYTQTMDIDPPIHMLQQESADPYHTNDIQQEARLLQSIRAARNAPLSEDEHGRNGFHCLAAATLSSPSVTQKYGLDEEGLPNPQKRRRDKANKYSDSSADKLEFRRTVLQNLIVAGVDPNHYDLQGNTPLMAFAAQLPEDDDHIVGLKIIKELIEAGANVNARNRAGETALHIAVRCGHKLAVKQLVNSGANVHARDAAGRSVLEVADVKMRGLRGEDEAEYAHLEACRAWLSGTPGGAVQEPTVMQEWGVRITGQS